ncbi:hypothetical protein CDL12_23904 [Handroanthus impetiginosus]|uniref:Transmembrane protein n=1 Tax=Handroanthus impetiginosus TaxID=429701 RepID=A0A2G9GED2_9LAMI|nr:hypothetical protein CDL12_23904 [Handroanthus impetiginosus]
MAHKMIHTHRQLLHSANFLFSPLSPFPFPHSLNFPFRPSNHSSLCSAHNTWLAQISEELTTAAITAVSSTPPPLEEGPIELPSSISSIIAAYDDPNVIQTATSVFLTGAFTLILFRSLRRRAKRAKQMRVRSSGAKKSWKEEAIGSLRTMSKSPVKAKSPPSPDQALLGALIAAAFGVLLYKFTTSIEYTLNHQTLSNNYSVRQITITIRTIINGLCYLATFVFGFNSLGLFLYSGQLAMNSFVEVPSSEGKASLSSELHDVESSGRTILSEDQTQTKHNNEDLN